MVVDRRFGVVGDAVRLDAERSVRDGGVATSAGVARGGGAELRRGAVRRRDRHQPHRPDGQDRAARLRRGGARPDSGQSHGRRRGVRRGGAGGRSDAGLQGGEAHGPVASETDFSAVVWHSRGSAGRRADVRAAPRRAPHRGRAVPGAGGGCVDGRRAGAHRRRRDLRARFAARRRAAHVQRRVDHRRRTIFGSRGARVPGAYRLQSERRYETPKSARSGVSRARVVRVDLVPVADVVRHRMHHPARVLARRRGGRGGERVLGAPGPKIARDARAHRRVGDARRLGGHRRAHGGRGARRGESGRRVE
mmetsp:Transcript_5621/g.23809  ORF Transcript_5621/g.23809 Transcript_5621/m.23809 type:complete len:307 (-) Transcript_5621:35-955(-)